MIDAVIYNDEEITSDWDGVWEGKSQIVEDGWIVEMRIPFSQLKFNPADEQIWGYNFQRDIARKNEFQFIGITPRNEGGFVSKFPTLLGIKNINPPRQIELLPFFSSKASFITPTTGDPYNDGSVYDYEIGGDFKIGIGSNLTLNATINPDFGQVEVDPAVVNLSDAETFFSEKRPFFIEGADIFDNFGRRGANSFYNYNFPNPTFFYSRRIGRAPQGNLPSHDFSTYPSGTRILGAGKLTGKLFNQFNIGTIHAVTNSELADIRFSGKDSTLEIEPLTYYSLYRAQSELNDGKQSIGFLSTITTRSFERTDLKNDLNSFSMFHGVDGYYFLDNDKEWILSGWAGLSYVKGNEQRLIRIQRNSGHYFQRPDASHLSVDSSATSLSGYATRISLNKQKGRVYMNAGIGIIHPNFEINDLGFGSRTDVINGHYVLGYRWNEPTDYFRSANLNTAIGANKDFENNLTWMGFFLNGSIRFLNYYSIYSGIYFNPETKNTRKTRGGPMTINPMSIGFNSGINSDNREKIIVSTSINYNNNTDAGSTYYGEISFTWKPVSNIAFSFSPSLSKFISNDQYHTTFSDPTAVNTFGRRYVFSDLEQLEIAANFRLNWTFTPQLTLELFVQPLVSTEKYSEFKELKRGNSYDFLIYGQEQSTLISHSDSIRVDPDGSGPAGSFLIRKKDRETRSLRGNSVLRWEFLPGSTLYLVWTQSRYFEGSNSQFELGEAFQRLIDSEPDNIFAIKISYWFPF